MPTETTSWQMIAETLRRKGWTIDAVPGGTFREPRTMHRITAKRAGAPSFIFQTEEILRGFVELEAAIAEHQHEAAARD